MHISDRRSARARPDASLVPAVRPLGTQPLLTGVRGVAVTFVLLYHAWPTVFSGGFIGVDIFFVLSGFLITSLLVEEHAKAGAVSIRNFYIRRFLRILPALFILVAITTAIVFATWPSARTAVLIFAAASLFDFANFAVLSSLLLHSPIFEAYTWTISAEEQFYFLWPPLLIMALARSGNSYRSRRKIIAIVLGAAACSAAIRMIACIFTHGYLVLYYAPITHMDGLLAGCALALARSWSLDSQIPRSARSLTGAMALLTLIGVCMTVKSTGVELYAGGYVVVVGAAVLLIYASCDAPRQSWLRWLATPALTFMGRISYSVYLWSALSLYYFDGSTWMRLAGVSLSIVAGTLSYFGVEKPALRLKRRYSSNRAPRDMPVALQVP